MTSMRRAGTVVSRVGAGGGGGMQLADGYRFGDRSYSGLGLGAGVGSDEAEVQYSYFDYEGSGRPPRPIHDHDPALIADYEAQLGNLIAQLQAGLAAGATIVVRGGGGMGAGVEYLMGDGEAFRPHALSTQAGFQYRYEFQRPGAAPARGGPPDDTQQSAYAQLGDFYRTANAAAYETCGRDYSNFPCICPTAHAIVICLMGRALGDPTQIPVWLQQQHCPNDPAALNRRVDSLTSYQHLLLDRASAAPQPSCRALLRAYFESLDTPPDP